MIILKDKNIIKNPVSSFLTLPGNAEKLYTGNKQEESRMKQGRPNDDAYSRQRNPASK